MNDRGEKLPNELLDDNEAGCSDISCCPPKTSIIRDMPKVRRNDSCICGNGRKYKKC